MAWVAHVLNTPLPALYEMEVAELLGWAEAATRVMHAYGARR